MSEKIDELYQDLILDHYKHPRCKGLLVSPDAGADVVNPLCGDQISLRISAKDNIVVDVSFEGKGCAISQASASMMAESCKGKTIDEVQTLISTFKGFMVGESDSTSLEQIGNDLVALEGVKKFTARIKCAVLSWDAMERCLKNLAEPNAKPIS